jgi:hypothetical protein
LNLAHPCTQLELGSSEFDAQTAALEVGLSLMLGLPRNGIHDSLINCLSANKCIFAIDSHRHITPAHHA